MNSFFPLNNYDLFCQLLFIRLSGLHRNIPANVPFRQYADMRLTYHVLLRQTENDVISMTVTQNILDHFNITLEELHEEAVANCQKLLPPVVRPLNLVMQDLSNQIYPDCPQEVFYISNNSCVSGAEVILYPSLLKKLSEELDSGLFLIPSSTEEFLAMKDTIDFSAEQLHSLLITVNQTCVSEDKILSEYIYHYDPVYDRLQAVVPQVIPCLNL